MLCVKKVKLYVVYVDFAKAYDLVPRQALIDCLVKLGYGYLMVLAIASLYGYTKMMLGAAMITTTINLRQGSTTS